jgi:hypothetical protein
MFVFSGDSIRQSDPWCLNSTEPIGGFDWPLKLALGTNLLKLLISSRGRSNPTDRFRQIPILGSHQIPRLGIRMSVHNPESDRILSTGWIRSDSLTWDGQSHIGETPVTQIFELLTG